ncbi:hypothetical protein, partial [Streptomyces sp. UNOC14_S4]|uniref:hypothetical protein n=1 Tax=Streptomyces sp. UNOC14_S4 TaxID=2872340 RepID=UPI001E5F66C3
MTALDPALTSAPARWLLCRETLPYRARETWAYGHSAGIRVGEHFDALFLPADMVEQRLPGSIRTRDAVEAHLRAAGVDHGVIATRNRLHYVVLVPAGTSTTWDEPGTWCYGKHSPAPYITAP